jgi:hypothetical protein
MDTPFDGLSNHFVEPSIVSSVSTAVGTPGSSLVFHWVVPSSLELWVGCSSADVVHLIRRRAKWVEELAPRPPCISAGRLDNYALVDYRRASFRFSMSLCVHYDCEE